MKILHVCLGCFYIDNFSYQENLLPKYHKKMGYDVRIVASTLSFNSSGDACNVEPKRYINEFGIEVTRLPYLFNLTKLGRFFRVYKGFYEELVEFNPDIIFVHGCQFLSIRQLKKYVSKYNTTVYIDNHADFSNSARNFVSKKIIHGIMWKYCAQSMLPYTKKYYGVLPARVDFLENVYDIPKDKIDLLVMGVDDDLIQESISATNIYNIKSRFDVKQDELLLITGGKIDHAKEEVLLLEEVVKNIEGIKLVIFGSIIDDMKDKVLSYVDNRKIYYIGWLDNVNTAKYIAASDLAIYPGRHSTLWEETVGLGVPMVVKKWVGTEHVNINGNVCFIDGNDKDELMKLIVYFRDYRDRYEIIKAKALEAMKEFSYENIAEKSIGD